MTKRPPSFSLSVRRPLQGTPILKPLHALLSMMIQGASPRASGSGCEAVCLDEPEVRRKHLHAGGLLLFFHRRQRTLMRTQTVRSLHTHDFNTTHHNAITERVFFWCPKSVNIDQDVLAIMDLLVNPNTPSPPHNTPRVSHTCLQKLQQEWTTVQHGLETNGWMCRTPPQPQNFSGQNTA